MSEREAESWSPSPESFDREFLQLADSARTNRLFDEILGPFPVAVEPFSLVPRGELERLLSELKLRPGDHLLDLCCGREGIGMWFAGQVGARLTGVDWSPVAIADASRRRARFSLAGRAEFCG